MSRAVRSAAIAGLVAALIAAILVPMLVSVFSAPPTGLDVVEEAWQVIFSDYVDTGALDAKVLSEGAIRGLIEAIGDPYSAYLDAERYEDILQSRIAGAFGGIGAEVTIADGWPTVVAPIKGTPAEREGLRPGDKILEIDGQSTEGMSLEEAVLKIRGEPGTQVTLRVLHEDAEDPVDMAITREEIKVDTVYPQMLADGIAYVNVTYFSNRTGSEMVSALEEMLADDVAGIVLDLRDNPGGVLTSAVTVASQFLDEGIVLYSVDNEDKRRDWYAEGEGLARTLPLAVLVNSETASAGEVVAGALQDYGHGRLIGITTHGKGSVNHYRRLSDGSAIYITIARWYTPNGRLIEGQGIDPDEVVDITAEDVEQGKDPQLDTAIEYIKSQL